MSDGSVPTTAASPDDASGRSWRLRRWRRRWAPDVGADDDGGGRRMSGSRRWGRSSSAGGTRVAVVPGEVGFYPRKTSKRGPSTSSSRTARRTSRFSWRRPARGAELIADACSGGPDGLRLLRRVPRGRPDGAPRPLPAPPEERRGGARVGDAARNRGAVARRPQARHAQGRRWAAAGGQEAAEAPGRRPHRDAGGLPEPPRRRRPREEFSARPAADGRHGLDYVNDEDGAVYKSRAQVAWPSTCGTTASTSSGTVAAAPGTARSSRTGQERVIRALQRGCSRRNPRGKHGTL